MIQGLTQASPASIARAYGFDGKFVLNAGFEFTFDAEGSISYEEKSGFKNEDGEDIMTVFFARKTGEVLEGVTMGALTRATLPNNAQVNPQASKYVQGVQLSEIKPLFTTKVTATEVASKLSGKTIKLMAVQSYSAVSQKGKAYTGKSYHWVVK